jgi:type IV pilus assembly protein PilF
MIFIIMVTLACGSVLNEKDQKDAKYHHRLAYGHFFESGDSDAALQEALKSIKLNPSSAEVHMLLGLIYTGRNDLLKALNHYQKSVEIKPEYYEAKNNLGTIYLALSMWQKAIKIFTELTSIDEYRTPAMGYNNLGWAYYNLGDFKGAQKYFITATQLNPRLCPPHNNIGMTYIELKDLERAARSLKLGIKQCPRYAEPHLHLGRVQHLLNRSESALVSWRICKKLSPSSEVGLRCDRLIKQSTLR